MELTRLIQHPEEMSKETLYDLRALVALHPYYQTARLLMLQNLYILHDASFDEELRKAAIYITDRKIIFQMVEAAHYQLKTEGKKKEKFSKDSTCDRTSDLINNFLDSIPTEEKEEKNEKKRKPTPTDAAIDYVAYLMESDSENCETEGNTSRTIALIDTFIDDGGFKLPKTDVQDYQPEFVPEVESENIQEGQPDSNGIFTETLARIYIKQNKYERALQIIERLNNKHPQKSAYYTDQMRFLEKLILIEHYK